MDAAEFLKSRGLRADRNKDQHFLTDDKILDDEVRAAQLKQGDVVLEVGAGIGNLTRKLAAKCKVIAIEKDYSFSGALRGIPDANIVFGDALEVLESLRKSKTAKWQEHEEFNKIVSNIPYSISQDIVLEFMRHEWKTAVLVVQKEFADKLVGRDKLGLLMEDCADVKITRRIPAEAFYPKAVPSSMVVIEQKKQMDDGYWKFLCAIFKDRNRNVKNVVAGAPPKLAKKKVHQLTAYEARKLYEASKG